jgi:hypothetical protein
LKVNDFRNATNLYDGKLTGTPIRTHAITLLRDATLLGAWFFGVFCPVSLQVFHVLRFHDHSMAHSARRF